MKLQEDTREPTKIFSFNDTFDVLSDNEYYQILFIESITTTRVISDFVFWSKHLFVLVNESKSKGSNQREFPFNVRKLGEEKKKKISYKLV